MKKCVKVLAWIYVRLLAQVAGAQDVVALVLKVPDGKR